MTRAILVIEDDVQMIKFLSEACEGLGYDVESASDGKSGLEKALSSEYALIVCDVNLPRLNGFEICRELRKKNDSVPLLLLTSRSDEVDKVLGLNLGADDYVTKPFSLQEFLARVHALLRRAQFAASRDSEAGAPPPLTFGDLVIDPGSHEVRYRKEIIPLTALEFDLLYFLAQNPGRVFTHDDLMKEVWGYQSGDFSRTITAQLSRLRRKLEADPDRPRYVLTVRGVGYRFAPVPDPG